MLETECGLGGVRGGGGRIDTDRPTVSSPSLAFFRNPSFVPMTFMAKEANDMREREAGRGFRPQRDSSSGRDILGPSQLLL